MKNIAFRAQYSWQKTIPSELVRSTKIFPLHRNVYNFSVKTFSFEQKGNRLSFK